METLLLSPTQKTSVCAAAAEALQDRVHQGAIAAGTDCPDHSTVPAERGEDLGLCASQEARGAARYCYTDAGAHAAQQARGLLHSLQDPEGGDWSLSEQHCPALGIWCARRTASPLGAQQLLWRTLSLDAVHPATNPISWLYTLTFWFFVFFNVKKKINLTCDKVYDQRTCPFIIYPSYPSYPSSLLLFLM